MRFALLLATAVSLLSSAEVCAAAWNVGSAVGAATPPSHATDLKGAPASLRAQSGRNGVVPVFFRAPEWRPYCQKQLMGLKAAPEALEQRGYKLAATSCDPTDVMAAFTSHRQIPHPMLCDPGSVIADSWSPRDTESQLGSLAWGVPNASIHVISPEGVLKAKLAEDDYKAPPPLCAVLAVIDGFRGMR